MNLKVGTKINHFSEVRSLQEQIVVFLLRLAIVWTLLHAEVWCLSWKMIMHCCTAPKDKLHNGRCFVILFYISDVFANYKGLLFLFIQGYSSIVLATNCRKIRVLLNVTLRRPPIIPTPRPHLKVTWMVTLPWFTWEAVTRVECIPCWGLLRHMLANGALVYPRQGGRYRATWHWGSDNSVVNEPLKEPGRTSMYVCFPSFRERAS